MTRKSIPNSAFACVLQHKGSEYKLARHHNESVRDGSEHDTVDPALLRFALATIDQLPITEEEREKVRLHLKDHENALAKLAAESGDAQPVNLQSSDPNRESSEGNPDRARKLVNSDNDGKVDGNNSLKNPQADMVLEPNASAVVRTEEGTTTAQLVQTGGKGNLFGGTPTKPGQKPTDAGRPKGDHQDTLDVNTMDDVEKKAGKGTPAHPAKVSEGPKDTARPGVESDGGEMVETNPAVKDPADVPTSKGSKKAEALHPDTYKKDTKAETKSTPTKKGKEKGDPKAQDDGDKSEQPKGDVEAGKKEKAGVKKK